MEIERRRLKVPTYVSSREQAMMGWEKAVLTLKENKDSDGDF